MTAVPAEDGRMLMSGKTVFFAMVAGSKSSRLLAWYSTLNPGKRALTDPLCTETLERNIALTAGPTHVNIKYLTPTSSFTTK